MNGLPTMPEREQLAKFMEARAEDAKQFNLAVEAPDKDWYDYRNFLRIAEILRTYIPTNKEMLSDMRREHLEQQEFSRLFNHKE